MQNFLLIFRCDFVHQASGHTDLFAARPRDFVTLPVRESKP